MSESINIGKNIRGIDSLDSDEWLWCLHCEKFFQGKELCSADESGERQSCPFCGTSGYGVDIYNWDDWCKDKNGNRKEHWPKEDSELNSGMRCQLGDMSPDNVSVIVFED